MQKLLLRLIHSENQKTAKENWKIARDKVFAPQRALRLTEMLRRPGRGSVEIARRPKLRNIQHSNLE